MRIRLFAKILAALLLVAMVPMTALGLMVRQQVREELEASADKELLLKLDGAAAHINAYVEKYKALLVSTASLPSITSLDPQENQKAITALGRVNSTFEGILVTNATGMQTADINAKDASALISLADRPYFQEIKGGADLSQSTSIS